MSSPSRRHPPVPVREVAACMCASGGACSSFAPGHALHLIQARLAAATPAAWVDAIVESVSGGEIALRVLADDARIVVWHAAGTEISAGEPVALHSRYGVLSTRDASRNVVRVG